jgi:hypothetical protein
MTLNHETFLVSDLKVISAGKDNGRTNFGLLHETHLEVASEHRARVNTKASVDVKK